MEGEKMLVVGRRHRALGQDTPEACYARYLKLQAQINRLNPYPKPRGFVFKARTWDDYARWRKAQTNPRLW